MKRQRICIDISNVVPGKGGTGGGITTYAINLVKNLNNIIDKDNCVIYCLKNSMFTSLDNLGNLEIINIPVNNSNFLSRLIWLHIRLPFFCLSKKIKVLHRIVPELPLIKVCKYVITQHDFMFDLYLQKPHLKKYLSKAGILKFNFFKNMSHGAVRKSDGIIVPANTIKKELEDKFNMLNKKVLMSYEAAEKPVNVAIGKNNKPGLRMGVIAGFFPHKGHLKVLHLAKKLIENGFDDFKIFFRGSQVHKNYVEDIKDEIKKYKLEEYVIFEPFVSKISLKEIYENYDLVLMMSEYEGFGLPVLEAQSHSIPVVCSNIPIFKELLEQSAFYLNSDFKEEEVVEFIQKIEDENIMNNMALNGLENVKRFSWNKMAKDTLLLYQSFFN